MAKKGLKDVAPNPMVGCVIVHNNTIIGQGYHQKYGEAHAEVNAINNVEDKELLRNSTLYVNLEPCSHFGKTPPCSNLIIESKIPKVIIGCIDTYSEVSGRGIEKLRNAGIEVIVGVLEKESKGLNKRFFTFHEKKRPYIILKWAQTQDGFIDVERNGNEIVDNWITSPESKILVQQWRSEEQAIMIGTNTALNDNPKLTVREVQGENPIRIVLDMNLRLPNTLNIYDGSSTTLVFNSLKNELKPNIEYNKIEKDNILNKILTELHNRNILSVIVEGGAQLLNSFIEANLWDEARVFVGCKEFKSGLNAPEFNFQPYQTLHFGSDVLSIYRND